MTNEEAIRVLNVARAECEWSAPLEYQEAFKMAIEALKEQPEHRQNTMQKQPDLETLGIKTGETCEDVINRRDAIDALDVLCQEHRYKIPGERETYSQYNEAWQDALDRAEGAIFNLPSAQPERKKGLWKVIRYNGDMQRYARCKCGYEYGAGKFDGLKFVALKLYNFCPNCGAKMEVEEWPDKDKFLLQSPITT